MRSRGESTKEVCGNCRRQISILALQATKVHRRGQEMGCKIKQKSEIRIATNNKSLHVMKLKLKTE